MDAIEPIDVNYENSDLTHLVKLPMAFEKVGGTGGEKMKLSLGNVDSDPYLASAIEFMYSEDTEDDFNTLGRK